MADEDRQVRPSFRRRLLSGLPDHGEPARLDPDEQRVLAEQLREITLARDEAAVQGKDYLIR